MKDLLSVNEASVLLSLSPQTVYRKLQRGELEGVRFGRTVRIPRSSLSGEVSRPALSKASRLHAKIGADKILPAFLHPLFWEFNTRAIKAYDQIVLERVMELGDLSGLQWLRRVVPKKKLLAYLDSTGKRRLTPRSYSFWQMLLSDG